MKLRTSSDRPPRARGQLLAETIERVLIDHFDGHRADIEAKLRALADGSVARSQGEHR